MGAQLLDPQTLRNGDHAQYQWGVKVQELLEFLVDRTQSNYAIFRTLDKATGRLIMECMAPAETSRQVPPLHRASFWIPREKDPGCFGVADPLRSWGITARSGAVPANCGPLTIAEQAFADWVQHKAWFPICVGTEVTGLVILLRGKSVPYRTQDIARAWLTAQEAVSHTLNGAEHAGFCAAVAGFNRIRHSANEHALLRLTTRSLASRFGLQWHRVWLFQATPEGAFACRGCLGELNKERWWDALAAVHNSFASLDDELTAAAHLPEQDGLAKVCCDPTAAGVLSLAADMVMPRKDEPSFSECLLRESTGPFASAWADYQQWISQTCERQGIEFLPDAHTHYIPLDIADRRWIIVASQAYDPSGAPTACAEILTACYLHHATRVVSEWYRYYDDEDEARASAAQHSSPPDHLIEHARRLAGRYTQRRD